MPSLMITCLRFRRLRRSTPSRCVLPPLIVLTVSLFQLNASTAILIKVLCSLVAAEFHQNRLNAGAASLTFWSEVCVASFA
jgi:hypothetical protein